MRRGGALSLLVLWVLVHPTANSQTIPLRPRNQQITPDPGIMAVPQGTPLDELQTTKNELKETQVRLQAFEAENEALRRRNELIKQSLKTLNESLAVANGESELFRRQYGDLKLRMEALGMESVGDNKQALEERLLMAVRDLGLLREEKEKLSERLVALTETVLLYMKAAPVSDPQLRMDVEAQMRAANQSLDESVKSSAATSGPVLDINSGSVVSVKDDLSLVVINIGLRNGVQAGTPFRVVRSDKLIAKVRVIEVRDRISGAVIEDYAATAGNSVKIGDHLQLDAMQ